MLRIRLSRVGRKHDPSYRMIVTEKGRGPQTGNYVEQVGTYDARSDEHTLEADRITYWIDNGAQPSDTVHNLLVKAGVIEADTVNPLPKKTPIVTEAEEVEDEDAEAEEVADDVDTDETSESEDESEGDAEEKAEADEDEGNDKNEADENQDDEPASAEDSSSEAKEKEEEVDEASTDQEEGTDEDEVESDS